MGSRADFYINEKDGMRWLGSLYHGGEPWNISPYFFIQRNKVKFEELIETYLSTRNHGETKKWPWDWPDSFMTDYSYIFDENMGKVIAYIAVEKMLFDPLKIVNGEDLNSAEIKGAPDFPIMGEIKFPEKSYA
jgi:hypothetical protein